VQLLKKLPKAEKTNFATQMVEDIHFPRSWRKLLSLKAVGIEKWIGYCIRKCNGLTQVPHSLVDIQIVDRQNVDIENADRQKDDI
jgi:hypothetical protein